MNERHLQPHRYLGGTEMEYGLSPIADKGHMPEANTYTELALANLPDELCLPKQNTGLTTKGGFAANGARVYQDVGQKLEYCTPECTSYAGTVHALIAGEEMVIEAVKKVADRLEKLRNIKVFGRVIDEGGITWGHHESYTVTRRAFDTTAVMAIDTPTLSLQEAMLAHFATRTIFTGAGILMPTRSGATELYPAQKIPRLNKATSTGTTNEDKALFNLRDESLAVNKRWARLHVTSGDYNISPWASWLKIGSTAIIAYLVDVGYIRREDSVHLPPGTALTIAQNVGRNANHKFEQISGGHGQAIDVQERLCNLAKRFNETHPDLLTAEDKLVLYEWQRAIDDYRVDPSRLMYRVDWITRKNILERYEEKHHVLSYEKLRKIEKAWDDLDPAIGIGVRLRHTTQMPLYDPAEIARLHTEPPKGSRAELRGRIIKEYSQDNELYVDWFRVAIKSASGTISVRMNNPFQSQMHQAHAHLLTRLRPGSTKVE